MKYLCKAIRMYVANKWSGGWSKHVGYKILNYQPETWENTDVSTVMHHSSSERRSENSLPNLMRKWMKMIWLHGWSSVVRYVSMWCKCSAVWSSSNKLFLKSNSLIRRFVLKKTGASRSKCWRVFPRLQASNGESCIPHVANSPPTALMHWTLGCLHSR